MSDTCSDCEQTDHPFVIPVVDEDGSFEMCGLCALQLVNRLGRSGNLTLLVTSKTAVPQN